MEGPLLPANECKFYCDPGFQIGVAEDFGVDRTTVCKTVNYVMDQIILKAQDRIKFPSTMQDMYSAKFEWKRRFRLPTVVGALDCTLVEKNHLYMEMNILTGKVLLELMCRLLY